MADPVVRTLQTNGAVIYQEIRGNGPTLLIIPGGAQDAGVFVELANALADEYKVVTYDPRGNSRTITAVPAGDLVVAEQADDAAEIIRANGEPADVFGTSGGAQIALDLAARHPELVRTVIAHEPPAAMALDDPERVLAKDRALLETFRRDGVEAAMGQFLAENGLEEPGPEAGHEMSPQDAETFQRVSGNFEYWLAHGLMPLTVYTPDVAALKAGNPKVIVAIGDESSGQPIAEMGEALATKLGHEPVPFPGDHMGFASQTEAFAEALRKALKPATRGQQ